MARAKKTTTKRSNKLSCYFSQAITLLKEFDPRELDKYMEVYEYIEKTLTKSHKIKVFHPIKEDSNIPSNQIYWRDLEEVDKADFLVVELSVVSWGVGQELTYAIMRGKPILALYNSKSRFKMSEMVSGAGLRFRSYNSNSQEWKEQIARHIAGFLPELKEYLKLREKTLRKNNINQRLLVSVRGKSEALEAYKGGAHIIDVEYPESALGTPYPLNIMTVRKAIPNKTPIATNIGEDQIRSSTSCQAALGVAFAGADIVKAGLAGYDYKEAKYLGRNIVRTIKSWFPEKKVIPAVFADKKYRKIFDPINEGPKLAKEIKADGILIDTYDKESGKTLLNLLSLVDIEKFVKSCHRRKIEAWIAGSITKDQMPDLWKTKVDVICVRAAACEQSGNNRFGKIKRSIVKSLVKTI